MSSITKVHPAMIDARFVIGLSGTVVDGTGSGGTGSGGTGAQGPAGPVGPTGPQGAQGPAGSADSAVGVGSALPATGTEGQAFYNTTDSFLYIYHNGAWIKASSAITGNAPGGIEIVSSLPASGTIGQVVYNKADDKLYEWSGTAWVAAAPTITATQITDGSITTPKLAANAITSDKLAANSIIAGKVAAGAIGASEIAAGAITAGKLAANSVTAGTIAAGIITATNLAAGVLSVGSLVSSTASNVSGVYFHLGGTKTIFGNPVCVLLERNSNTGALPFVASNIGYGSDSTAPAYFLGNRGTSNALEAYGITGDTSSTTYRWSAQALLAGTKTVNYGIYAIITSSGSSQDRAGVFLRSSISEYNKATFAAGTSTDPWSTVTTRFDVATPTHAAYAIGAVGPFTGAHDALYSKKQVLPQVGDILIDVKIVPGSLTVSDCISIVELSSKPEQKAAIGVFTSESAGHTPTSLYKTVADESVENGLGYKMVLREGITDPEPDYTVIQVNALGEGAINVCGENGDIEAGDLIATSSIPGKGMRQSDDIVRAITVAKARESVSFSSPDEIKFIACVYLCG